jgi:hypothetical protein
LSKRISSDFWTNKRFAGGAVVKQEVALDRMPLFVRAGSILPMGSVMQYATEKPDVPYDIRVYPGADASFTLYEDDNETYGCEQGKFATTELKWDDTARKLTIGKRRGGFPGMTKERDLHFVSVASDCADERGRCCHHATASQRHGERGAIATGLARDAHRLAARNANEFPRRRPRHQLVHGGRFNGDEPDDASGQRHGRQRLLPAGLSVSPDFCLQVYSR